MITTEMLSGLKKAKRIQVERYILMLPFTAYAIIAEKRDTLTEGSAPHLLMKKATNIIIN